MGAAEGGEDGGAESGARGCAPRASPLFLASHLIRRASYPSGRDYFALALLFEFDPPAASAAPARPSSHATILSLSTSIVSQYPPGPEMLNLTPSRMNVHTWSQNGTSRGSP